MACSYLNVLKIFTSFWIFGQQYYKNGSIHLNDSRHSHKKQIVWKHRSYLLIFLLELEIFDTTVQKIHENSKKCWLLWGITYCKWLEAVLVNFCCFDYGTNASEAVQKISTRTPLQLCKLTKTANFIAYPYEKTYLAVYYLLIGDTSQVSAFFPGK